MSASTARAGAEVHFRATGVAGVQQATRTIAQSAGQMQARVGSASLQISSAIENIARQGKVTGESMKQLATQTGQLAFMFGPQGAIAGAVLTLGVAMVSFWQRQRREMEETARKAEEISSRMVNAGDFAGLNQAFRATETGTAANRYQDGIIGRQNRIGDLNAQLAAVKSREEIDEIYKLIREEERLLAPLIAERERLRAIILDPRTGQLSSFAGMPGVTTTANAPGFKPKATPVKPMGAKNELRGMIEASEAARRRVEGSWLSQSVDNMMPKVGVGAAGGVDMRGIIDNLKGQLEGLGGRFTVEVAQPMADIIRAGIAGTIGAAVGEGFRAAFSGEGIGATFEAFGRAVLAGIGGIMQQMGAVWLEYGLAMSTLTAGLFNPVTSGPTALAIGALLMGLGTALAAMGGGGGGRSGAGSYGPSGSAGVTSGIVDRGLINPLNPLGSNVTPQKSVVVNATIIGPNDPSAQRGIRELIRNAETRGNL